MKTKNVATDLCKQIELMLEARLFVDCEPYSICEEPFIQPLWRHFIATERFLQDKLKNENFS